ncbi:sporulation protein YunB [Jeotgalibacillus soli]|uniref:Sporulation protein YunB n=1 Tax=Jeotgalibacillus soli TaxID=889306 RepID=A0A0C2VLD1_9BACL|nr:sporulation protein YunB [Jeotgalibacillus soli]KIL45271.1 hypothetical protein KP78_28150 [Jeotgalibacillus soli]
MFRYNGRPRKNRLFPSKSAFFLSFILFSISSVFSLWLVDNRIEPSIMSIAETKTREIAFQAINDAISEEMAEMMDIKKLIIIHETSEGVGYSFNPELYNKLDAEAGSRVQRFLDYRVHSEDDTLDESADNNGIIYYMPLGMTTGNTLLASLGPKIPVRFETVGNVATSVTTSVEESGINNSYLEIHLEVKVNLKVIIPSLSKDIVTNNSIKIGDLFLHGDVPEYYNGDGNNAVMIPR